MRVLAPVVVIALVASLLTGCIPNEAAPPADPLTVAELEAAGITVVADEAAVPDDPTTLVFTASQAEWVTSEANLGAGMVGAELDALAPVDEGMPPTSYLLASWMSTTDMAGAKLAASLMPEDTDYTTAPSLLFPSAAIALFVSDMMAAATDDSFEEQAEPQSIRPAAYSAPLDTACSTISAMYTKTINGIFGVLRLLPDVINGIKALGFFGTALALVLNGAITLAQGAVEGLISTITGPILNTMRTVISVLGIATLVVSYFTKERLIVKTGPSVNLPFGIQPAEGVAGTFTVSRKPLTKEWPDALTDCATALKVPLPDSIKAGSKADWRVTARPELITLKTTSTTITSEKTSTVDFVTGTEDAETAKGTALFDASRVNVVVPSKQASDFVDLVVKQLEDVKTSILNKIPSPLQGAVQLVFAKTVDPVIASVRATLTSAGGILSLKGDGVVYVTHHRPKEPTPKPTPTPEEPQDSAFCQQFREKVDVAAVDLQTAADPFSWAARFATALHAITAEPPADIADAFDVVLGFYDLAGQSSFENAQALADYVAANDPDSARAKVWTKCGAQFFPTE